MKRLENRRILVTGAASGIGQATALRLADEGGNVIAADVSAQGLETTLSLASSTARLTTLTMNISDEASVAEGVQSAVTRLGGLDALVNAAGILRSSHTASTTTDQWNEVIATNLTGTFMVVREALPSLLANPNSTVVNFSSTSAEFGHPYMAAYAASKGGIQSFTHSIALEYAQRGLRAVCVAPGGIKSGITDNIANYVPAEADWSLFSKLSPALPTDAQSATGAAMGSPASVAGVVAMLVSDDGAFITGTEIRIDGGTHL